MVRTYRKKTLRSAISEEGIIKAINDVLKLGLSVRVSAARHGIKKSTLHNRISKIKDRQKKTSDAQLTDDSDKEDPIEEFRFNSKYASQQVFTESEEKLLVQYLLKSSRINYGLTYVQSRKLAYEYAIHIQRKCPEGWEENKLAGIEWMFGFMRRHKNLSLRKPENTSLARSTAFNAQNVKEFFDNYSQVMKKYKFKPERIINIDETGLSTVLPSPRVVAETGKKQVGQVASGERGETTTMAGIVFASGDTLPPVFIFPRVRFKDHFMHGTPSCSLGLGNKSGWMTTELFLETMKHVKKNSKASRNNPLLVLLDNHKSHVSLEVILYCRDNGMILLSFPPHCSHRMQPLDVSVYGPFKSRLMVAENDFLASSGGKPIAITDIGKLAGIAYSRSFTIPNIMSGFAKSGIWPVNSQIFSENDFFGAYVTDRPDPSVGPSSYSIQADDDLELLTDTTADTTTADDLDDIPLSTLFPASQNVTGSERSPEDVRPYPKAAPRKTTGRVRKGKSRILTDTPEKNKLLQETLEKEKKRSQIQERKDAASGKRKKCLQMDGPKRKKKKEN